MKKYLGLGLLLAITGCHSNPYTGLDKRMTKQPPKEKPVNPSGFSCDVPDDGVDVPEGGTQPLQLTCRVPSGEAKIIMNNLPSFAKLDSTTPGLIILAPKTGDSVEPGNPTATMRRYVIHISLSSSDDPRTVVPQTLDVFVHRAAVSMSVEELEPEPVVLEGAVFRTTFRVVNKTFARGPFLISAIDAPPGTVISKTSDPRVFEISMRPDFTTVTSKNWSGYCPDPAARINRWCIRKPWRVNVIDPAGGLATKDTKWQILDVRQDPRVIVPNALTSTTTTADFFIQVEDPNGEVVPRVTVLDQGPGKVSVSEAVKEGPTENRDPYVMSHVVWSEVVAENKPSDLTMKLQSCVTSTYRTWDQCVTTPISVTFK